LNAPKAIDLITAPDIYLPIIIFFILFITTILVKKKFYKS
jgi:hypothetical protein